MAGAIAQTIYVQDPALTLPGFYLTGIDLFFRVKVLSSTGSGITVTLNEVENGTPTERVLPFSRVRLTPSQVFVSANASAATRFTFESPVFVETNREYAIVVSPDSGAGYELWVARVGDRDILDTSQSINVNSGVGVFFTSTNGRTWVPEQNQDLKYTLHRARFTSTGGTIRYTNANTEYVQYRLPNLTSNRRLPINGERMFVSNGIVTVSSNVKISITNTSVGVFPANAISLFAANRQIYLRSNTGARTDIRTITSVPNTSHIVVNTPPTFNDGNSSIGYLVSNGALFGKMQYVNAIDLALLESTANTTMNLRQLLVRPNYAANALLIGEVSGMSANVVELKGSIYQEVVGQLAFTSPPLTTTLHRSRGTIFTSNVQTSTQLENSFAPLAIDQGVKYVDRSRIIRSRSDELFYSSGTKSLQVEAVISSQSNRLSPFYDDIKLDVLTILNKISTANSSLLEEEIRPQGGRLLNKYISRSVTLTQEAEDLLVFLTAYRPIDTDIYVFCKLMDQEDGDNLNNKYWTPMTEVAPLPRSSKADLGDLRELQFKLPIGTNSTTTETAFLNSDNNGIVRYFTDTETYFDGFNSFKLKIILASNFAHIVPRVSDMRAICLQV